MPGDLGKAMKPDEISEMQEQNNGTVKPGRKRFTKKTVCWFLTAALVVMAALFSFAGYLYRVPDYNELLTRARLAQLPESTKNLQVETRPYMRNSRAVSNKGELFMRFQAEPNDIASFVNNSPGIDTNRFHPLNKSGMPYNPPWWIINRSASGRIYSFWGTDDGLHFGVVVVDEDSDTVLIYMCFIVNPQLRDMQNDFEEFKDDCDDFLDDFKHEALDIIGF